MCPVKEPHFFSDVTSKIDDHYQSPDPGEEYHTRIINDEKLYHSLFKGGEKCLYRGESSPSYLWDSNAAFRIHEYNPKAKIIVILRDPVERAFSHYQMAYNLGLEDNPSFYSIIENYNYDKNKIWGLDPMYIELGFYSHQLEKYSGVFPERNIKIIRSDQLKNSYQNCMADIFSFLGIQNIQIDKEIKNVARIAKYDWVRKLRHTKMSTVLHSIFGKINKNKIKDLFYKKNINTKEELDSKSYERLRLLYENELSKLRADYNIVFVNKKIKTKID